MKNLMFKLGMIAASLLSYLPASAYDFEVDGIYYNVLSVSDLTCEVTSGDSPYNDSVEIPATVNYNGKILSVISVGKNAFKDCANLKSLTIPSSINELEDYSFSGCVSLTDLKIDDGDNPLKIGYNGSHHSRNLPDYVTEYDTYYPREYKIYVWTEGLFLESPIKNLYIGRNFTYKTRDWDLYFDLPSEVVLPVCTPFSHHNYEKVTIGPKVDILYGVTFKKCSIKELSMPYASNPLKISHTLIDDKYHSRYDLRLFDKDTQLQKVQIDRNYCYDDGYSPSHYGLFEGITSLETVTIGEHITNIDESAFCDCIRLKDLNFGESVNIIGARAFQGCRSLCSIVLPLRIETIMSGAFADSGIARCDFGSSLKHIKSSAFANTLLVKIDFPSTLESIGEYAFGGCNLLQSVRVNDGINIIPEYAFRNCSNLKEIYLPPSLKTLEFGCFSGCKSLKQVSIPDYVETIEDDAFQGCDSLKIVDFGRGLKTIGKGVFGQSDLAVINLFTSNPPIVEDEDAFNTNTFLHCNCNVPKDKLETYLNASVWKSFWNIQDDVKATYILHQPTSEELFVRLNSNEETSSYQWYRMEMCGESDNDITQNMSDIEISSYGQDHPWIFNEDEGKWEWSYPVESRRYACLGISMEILQGTEITFDYEVIGLSGLVVYWNDFKLDSFGGKGSWQYRFTENCCGTLEIWAPKRNGCKYSIDNVILHVPEHVGERAIKEGTSRILDNNMIAIGDSVRCKVSCYDGRVLWSNTVVYGENTDVPVQYLYMDKTEAYLSDENQLQLHAKCIPENASEQALNWSCSDESVATVDMFGNVTKLADGEAIITATTTDGSNLSATCKVVIPEGSGIEDIIAPIDNGVYSVYNLQGILLIKTEDIERIRQLPTGIYIVNGKKILIR